MSDGSIIISTKLDNADLERELSKMKKQIEKLEQSTSAQEAKKAPLVQQAQELEVRMREARAEVDQYRSAWAAGVSGADKEQSEAILKAQQLEAEHAKVVAQIDKIDAKLQPAQQKLDEMKYSAGGIEKKLAEAASASNLMAPAIAAAEKHMDRFVARVKGLARRVFVFTLITAALRSLRGWMGKVIKTNSEATASIARLKGSLLTLAQPLVDVIIPAITAFVNILTDVISVLANIVSFMFGGTEKASAEAAEGLYDETDALEGVGKAAKKAGKSLASFDEINKLSGSSESGAGGGGSSSVSPDFSQFKTTEYKEKIDELTVYLSGALLALGAILTFSGANIPLGIGLMAAGAIGLASVAMENWGAMTPKVKKALTEVLLIIGGFMLVIGLILALTGVSIVKGIALMALGAAALAGSVAVNWNSMDKQMKKTLVGLLEVVGGFLLVIGLILALTGVNIPIGVALILAGAASLAAAAAIQWKLMGREVKAVLTEILLIAAGVLAAVGIILIATGHLGIGIGLLIAGAAALGTAAALNWDTVVETVRGPMGKIMALASGALLVLGVILALSGNLPLGIALIAAGSIGLVSVAALNWDAILSKLKEVWGSIKSWWSTNVAPKLTLTFWKSKFDNIKKGLELKVKDAVNAAISLFNRFIEWVNDKLNLSWGSFEIFGKEVIPAGSFQLLTIPKIPMLAQGAVIPPNREFLAVLGDQKSGTNIEAPLDTIVQAVMIALAKSGYSGNAQIIENITNLDGEVIYRKLKKVERRHGVSLANR